MAGRARRAVLSAVLAAGSVSAVGLAVGGSAHAVAPACVPDANFTTCTRLDYTGADQTFVVPGGVATISVKAWGAGGGGVDASYYRNQAGGGGGGFTAATFAVTPGQVLTVVAGQGGVAGSGSLVPTYGGGGAGGEQSTNQPTAEGSSGGGMSAVFVGPIGAGTALLVAGGGGGASPGADTAKPVAGGGGGRVGGGSSADGSGGGPIQVSGQGGTQTGGGAGATSGTGCRAVAGTGTQFQGGAGASTLGATSRPSEGGGGGGGGWFGGGGGKCQNAGAGQSPNGTGGGGSGFVAASAETGSVTAAGGNAVFGSVAGGPSGGAKVSQYIAGVGAGGGVVAGGGVRADGGNGVVVIQWASAPRITFTAALGTARASDTDQFSVAIRTGSVSGPVVSDPVAATTTGVGAVVTDGTGTTGSFVAVALSPVYLTETAAGTTSLARYVNRRVSCVDPTGRQEGLPVDVPFADGVAMTPAPAADIVCTVTNVVNQPALAITGAVAPLSVSRAGAPIDYSFTVTNTGNVSINTLSVTLTFAAPAGPTRTAKCDTTALASGVSTSCTSTYTASQADIDSGRVVVTASVRGADPTSTFVSAEAVPITVTALAAGVLVLTKSAAPLVVTAAGQAVAYAFRVTNNGNVTLSDLNIVDGLDDPATALSFVCPSITLAPGASTICTGTYTVTAADIAAGGVFGTAFASATPPDGSADIVSNNSSAPVTVPAVEATR